MAQSPETSQAERFYIDLAWAMPMASMGVYGPRSLCLCPMLTSSRLITIDLRSIDPCLNDILTLFLCSKHSLCHRQHHIGIS